MLTGGGTLYLSGSNTYTGGTMVESGLLVINNPAALSSGSVLYIGPGGSVCLGDRVGRGGHDWWCCSFHT